ncbi:unnamed protein product [Microthlaspi erraticum]|uniref:Mal d 1-associated protein n=1 Tax=Microthlaspi erraticum TaxID=1685480 RepID=A0A6D2I4M4_9BRAS|nr:unnamed protein product [Microthlaspi erraticum]
MREKKLTRRTRTRAPLGEPLLPTSVSPLTKSNHLGAKNSYVVTALPVYSSAGAVVASHAQSQTDSGQRRMKRIWVELRDDDSSASDAGNDITDKPLGDSGNCSTSTVVRSQCKTEEVEPGKFVRKCDKTEEILRHCFGKPSEVVQSTTEHTEEDVTNQMVAGKSALQENPLNFPGLRSDVDAIERHFLTGMKSFFEAAEDMRSSFFDIMGDDQHSSTRRGIPIEDRPKVEEHRNDENTPRRPYSSGEIDLSGLAKDV